MLKLGASIREYIFDSPGLRTFFSAVMPILASLFAGTFVLEITTPHGLAWGMFYRVHSFYALVVLSIVIYSYNRELYRHEREIARFLDNDYCVAYMRSKCLPEAADRYRELIRNGVGGEFERAMNELRKILR
jgi:hypothetical protein